MPAASDFKRSALAWAQADLRLRYAAVSASVDKWREALKELGLGLHPFWKDRLVITGLPCPEHLSPILFARDLEDRLRLYLYVPAPLRDFLPQGYRFEFEEKLGDGWYYVLQPGEPVVQSGVPWAALEARMRALYVAATSMRGFLPAEEE